MMPKPVTLLLTLGALALLAGCASAPSRFYTLNSTVKGGGASAAGYAIVVGPVSVPAEVDRNPITVQVAPNRVEIDEFNRWAEPLPAGIARVVAGDLSAILGSARVASAPLANFEPAYRVSIDVQRFETVPGTSAQLVAVWAVRRNGGASVSGRTVALEPVDAPGFDALAAAHSRALAKLSRDIAKAIRSASGTTPQG